MSSDALLLTRIAQMDAAALHRFATRTTLEDGGPALDAVVRHASCSLGTALLVYWRAKPYWYAQWASADECEDPRVFAMMEAIEQRVASGGYAHAGVVFDPRREKFHQAVFRELEKKRSLPTEVFTATTKTGVLRFAPTSA